MGFTVKLYVVEVAPGIEMNDLPPLALNRHCTLGVGVPVAAAVKVATDPTQSVWLSGLVVMTGKA
jgi:hypothetical protein